MVLAARGTRKQNGKEEKVEDEAEARTLRGIGKRVWIRTIATAVLVTVDCYVI